MVLENKRKSWLRTLAVSITCFALSMVSMVCNCYPLSSCFHQFQCERSSGSAITGYHFDSRVARD